MAASAAAEETHFKQALSLQHTCYISHLQLSLDSHLGFTRKHSLCALVIYGLFVMVSLTECLYA